MDLPGAVRQMIEIGPELAETLKDLGFFLFLTMLAWGLFHK
jgi:hypothetical protein